MANENSIEQTMNANDTLDEMEGIETVEELDAIAKSTQEKVLEEILPKLREIPNENILQLTIPVRVLVQEAFGLMQWCQKDKEQLERAGLDWGLVDDLPKRALAAKEAQSSWGNSRFIREDVQRRWNELSHESYELRNELIHYMRYAYRTDSDLLSRVNRISDGNKDTDMIQDLNDLAMLGRENLSPLIAVGLDSARLVEAADKSMELGVLKADATITRSEAREQKLVRDLTYTYLKDAIDTIRQCGQFVFWKNAERIAGYGSKYFRDNRKRPRTDSSDADLSTETDADILALAPVASTN